jgi:hypothetical protein
MKDYLLKPLPASYKVPAGMQDNSLIPRSYLQIRTASLPAFTNHKLGATRALDDAIRSMVASGYLMEAQKDRMVEGYGFHGKAYRIIRLPD